MRTWSETGCTCVLITSTKEFPRPAHRRALQLEFPTANGEMIAFSGAQKTTGHESTQRTRKVMPLSSNGRFRSTLCAAKTVVWDLDLQSGQVVRSGSSLEVLGIPSGDGDDFTRLVCPQDRPRLDAALAAAYAGEAPYNIEFRVTGPDGELEWVHEIAEVYRNQVGQPVRLCGVTVDITARKEAEQELARYRMLSEHGRDILLFFRTDGTIVDVNQAAVAAYGYTREELLGRPFQDLRAEATRADIPAQMKRVAQGPFRFETVHRRKDGTTFPVEASWSFGTVGTENIILSIVRDITERQRAEAALRSSELSSVRDPESGAIRLAGTFADITERRRTEDELRRLHQELAHLTRVGMLGQLSGALAHEINQPLAAILANAQAAERLIAREPPDVAEVRGALKDIIEADRRAGSIIRHLRAMLRKSEVQFQPLDINAVVREVLDLTHSDLVARQIAVEQRLALPLPSVHGDRVQLQQVLLNFIMNACDAMSDAAPEGRVLTVTTASTDDQSVEVCVVDTGGGFSSELQEHLFEPFITTKKNGLGLGLSICRSIVVAHGGSLWAENNAVGGAAFHVSLPAYRS